MTIRIHKVRLDWRAVGALAAATVFSLVLLLSSVRPVVACSCAMPGAMEEYATAENAIFTGTAGERAVRGVPVQVTGWLWGQGAAEVVWLTAASFGDSAMCGTSPPPPGTSWIWVAWVPDNGDFGTGLCSPAGRLDTPEGQKMLADAVSVFGMNAPPGATPQPTPAPESPPAPDPEAGARDARTLMIGAAVASVVLGLFGALVLVARRQNREGSQRP